MLRPVVALPLAAALLCGSAAAQSSPPEARVDSAFADVDGPTTPGCAVSVVRDGARFHERGRAAPRTPTFRKG